jgi:hypothetical protein
VVPGGRLGDFRHGTYPSLGDRTHAGIDIAAPCGTPVYSLSSGVVIDAITSPQDPHWKDLGYMVIIEHDLPPQRPFYALYLHLQEPPSSSGAVTKGTAIGKVGDTGRADGCHVHFEVRYFRERFHPAWGNIYGPGDQRDSPTLKGSWEDPVSFARRLLAQPSGSILGGPGLRPCVVNFRAEGSFWRGKRWSTFETADGLTKQAVYDQLLRALIAKGFEITRSDPSTGVMSGPALRALVTEETTQRVRVELSFAPGPGIILRSDDQTREDFCLLLSKAFALTQAQRETQPATRTEPSIFGTNCEQRVVTATERADPLLGGQKTVMVRAVAVRGEIPAAVDLGNDRVAEDYLGQGIKFARQQCGNPRAAWDDRLHVYLIQDGLQAVFASYRFAYGIADRVAYQNFIAQKRAQEEAARLEAATRQRLGAGQDCYVGRYVSAVSDQRHLEIRRDRTFSARGDTAAFTGTYRLNQLELELCIGAGICWVYRIQGHRLANTGGGVMFSQFGQEIWIKTDGQGCQ